MSTDQRARQGEGGFTLIEVLIAMIILAVGLMGLEALGIGAARAVARADFQTEYTAVATGQLERAVQQLRNQTAAPVAGTAVLSPTDGQPGFGAPIRITRTIQQLGPSAWSVSVLVEATAGDTRIRPPVSLSSVVFRP